MKFGYYRTYMGMDYRPPASFNESVFHQAGIHSAFVYDEPGVLAYYTEIRLVPLDGLMGDVAFQHDLATKGINAVALEDHIEGFIGPPVPYNDTDAKEFCEQIFLSAVKMNCVADGRDNGRSPALRSIREYRTPPQAVLRLDKDQIAWSQEHMVAVWRINPSVGSRMADAGTLSHVSR